MGNVLGIPLYDDPDLALHRDVAALLLVIGMRDGLYTGRSWITMTGRTGSTPTMQDGIINGLDKAEQD